MKMLDKMMDELHEEVEGARCYAEKYIENKARGNTPRANKFKEMASDELKHAGYLREMAVTDEEGIKRVYNLTENEVEAWEHAHKKINDEMAMVQHLLSM